MVHLCLNERLYEALEGIVDKDDLFCLPLHLSVGSIANPLDYASRQSIYAILDSQYESNIHEHIARYRSLLSMPEPQVTVWASACSWDLCGLLHVLATLPGKSFLLIDHSAAQTVLHTHERLHDLNTSDLSRLLPHARPLSPADIQLGTQKWLSLQHEDAPLRVMDAGSIRSVDASYYDPLLMEYIPCMPKRICCGIADLYAWRGQVEYECFLLARAEKLAEQGRLIALSDRPFTMYSTVYKA